MKTIWKYTLNNGLTSISMPDEAEILTVQVQANDICLWAIVDPNKEIAKRTFAAVETGENLPDDTRKLVNFINTLQFMNGLYIVHVFEVIDKVD